MSQQKKTRSKQQGFTIIELMISTTIFSLILMLSLAGIMQITKMYYGSITKNRTREVARTIVDDIAEAIRFSSDEVFIGDTVSGVQVSDVGDADAGVGYFCIGQKRYTFAIDRQVDNSAGEITGTKKKRHALWQDTPPACDGPANLNLTIPSTNGRELLAENMRLFNLSVTERDATRKIYDVAVGVAYGDDDLLFARPADAPTELTCEGGSFIGAEFCATTNFLVSVQKRL